MHERCSSAKQGWRDTSSWMLASREEALKLAPAWGVGTGERGLREEAWKKSREKEGGRLVEEKECWEAGGGGGG